MTMEGVGARPFRALLNCTQERWRGNSLVFQLPKTQLNMHEIANLGLKG